MMQTLISAQNVSIKRHGKSVLSDINFDVEPRDFITVIGPNGAGKSMLLKTLLGLFQVDKGKVIRKKGVKIGYVPQRLVPDHTMPISVERFIRLYRNVDAGSLSQVLEETTIADFIDKPLNVLSGGELQRVLLARALLDNPDLLVLDEPAQNLDVTGQLAFYKLLERIYKQRKIAIVMVSHDLHLVMASTKKVVCLFHHVCCSGTPQMVAKDPEFKSLFGEDMAKMMAVYHHSHDHDHVHDHHEGEGA